MAGITKKPFFIDNSNTKKKSSVLSGWQFKVTKLNGIISII